MLAFEPDHQNYLNLINVTIEHDLGSRINPYMLALSDATGTGSLYLSDLAPTDHKLINSRSTKIVEIAMILLDDFFARHADLAKTPVSLIKIDVQGAELRVLQGARWTLATWHPALLVELDEHALRSQGASIEAVVEFLASFGYRGQLMSSAGLSPVFARQELVAASLAHEYIDALFTSELLPLPPAAQ
jgi:FkbM family methyltransferase